jgi:2-polyprenyl-6-hydroxyphenyl methylase/3-demethylubiquinone-9 3-methyltransferase
MARIHTLSDTSEASRAPVRREPQRIITAMPRKARATSDFSATGPTTVDPSEIARFAALAESWWDPAGKFKPLHRLNPVRLGFLRNRLTAHFHRDRAALRPFEGLRLLDIGCGGGLVAEPMVRLGFAVTGIDAGEETVATARLHAEQGGLAIEYRAAAAETLAAAGERFDVVLALEIIEHVADLDAFVAAAAALVRPGGAFVAATLNRTAKSYLLAIIGAEYVLGWLPRGTHDWRKFVRPSELAAALRRHRLRLAEIAGVTYSPFGEHWALSADLDVNYMAFATA